MPKGEKIKENLIEALQKAQEERGWLSRETLAEIAARLELPPAKVMGAATFYSQFRLKPVGKSVITVCLGTACHVNGAAAIVDALSDELSVKEGGTTEDGEFTLETAACLGCCSLSPVMTVNGAVFGEMTAEKARAVINEIRGKNDDI